MFQPRPKSLPFLIVFYSFPRIREAYKRTVFSVVKKSERDKKKLIDTVLKQLKQLQQSSAWKNNNTKEHRMSHMPFFFSSPHSDSNESGALRIVNLNSKYSRPPLYFFI